MIAVCLAAAAAPSAFADLIVPQVVFYASLNGNDLSEPGSHSSTTCDTTGCVTAAVNLHYAYQDGGPYANVFADVVGSDTNYRNGGNAYGSISYYVGVEGPDDGSKADIDFDLSGTATLAGVTYGYAQGGADVVDSTDHQQRSISFCAAAAEPDTGCPDYGSGQASSTFEVDMTPNYFSTLFYTASCEVYGTGACFSNADPQVYFAPGFDSTGYTLVFSPIPDVPEPSTLPLMISATALVFVLRRSSCRRLWVDPSADFTLNRLPNPRSN